MNDEGIKGKIEKFIDEPIGTIEKAVNDLGKNKKFIDAIDDPRIAIEKGAKKGWEYIIYTGKEVKDTVTKDPVKKMEEVVTNQLLTEINQDEDPKKQVE